MKGFWNWLGELSNLTNGHVIAFYILGVIVGAFAKWIQP
jgi:hypothetical protein